MELQGGGKQPHRCIPPGNRVNQPTVPALPASRQPGLKRAQAPREEHTELSWLTHTQQQQQQQPGHAEGEEGIQNGEEQTGNWGMSRTAATSASALNSCRGACDGAGEPRAGPAPRPVPALLTLASSPKSPDGALGTPGCSLAANQTHSAPITPALGRVSESRTLPSPTGSQSQLHGHYLLLRMQVSSLPSSS